MLESIATNCNDKSTMYKYILDIYVMDDHQNYPTLPKDIYIGRIGQVTTLNRRSLSGGPAVLTDRKGALVSPTNHVLVRNTRSVCK
jgi:hypothetical protein